MPHPDEFPPLHTLPDEEIDQILLTQRANRVLPQTRGKAKSKKKKTDPTGLTLEDLRLLFPSLSDEELCLLLIGTVPTEDGPDEDDDPDDDHPDEDTPDDN